MVFEHRALYRVVFEYMDLWGFDGYAGFRAMLKRQVGTTVGLTFVHDNALSLREQPVAANSLFPGSLAFVVFPNKESQAFLTA